MRHWPWITLLLAAAAALNPVGPDINHSALFSNEQLSRNIGQAIVLIALAIALGLVMLEWLIRRIINKRRVEN